MGICPATQVTNPHRAQGIDHCDGTGLHRGGRRTKREKNLFYSNIASFLYQLKIISELGGVESSLETHSYALLNLKNQNIIRRIQIKGSLGVRIRYACFKDYL
jgi:hypothetical protein